MFFFIMQKALFVKSNLEFFDNNIIMVSIVLIDAEMLVSQKTFLGN